MKSSYKVFQGVMGYELYGVEMEHKQEIPIYLLTEFYPSMVQNSPICIILIEYSW